MIKHIVFWKIHKDGTNEERMASIEKFRNMTEYLKTIIPELQEATVAANLNEGDVFHVCIDSVFRSVEEMNTYVNHPEHQKVKAFISNISYDKVSFDYEF